MFNFFKKKKRSQGMNAVVLCEQGIAHACIFNNAGQPPTLQSVHFSPIESKVETASALKKLVQQNKLEDKSITTSLHVTNSNLVMIEKPEVAENEFGCTPLHWAGE